MQEKDIQQKTQVTQTSEAIRLELRKTVDHLNQVRRDHLIEFDKEKEKFQDLLHRYTALQESFQALKLTFEAKEEECLTLHSHTEIQKQQIYSLQGEITAMLDKLENIKNFYEIELEQRTQQLQNQRSISLKQMKVMQDSMRQEQVNNFKNIVKLKQEMAIQEPPAEKTTTQSNQYKRQSQNSSMLSKRSKATTTLNFSKPMTKKRGISETGGNTKSLASVRTKSKSSLNEETDSTFIQHDALLNSPLIVWLKQQLKSSWLKEKLLKQAIHDYSDRLLPKLERRNKELERQQAQVRAEVEMWMMRNEELESRLVMEGRKTWSLK